MDPDDRDDLTTDDRTTNDLTISGVPCSDVPISDVAQDTVAVDVLREGTAVVAVLAGEIDSMSAPAAQATVTGLVTDGRARPLVIDLSAVTFLSSRGIALVVDVADLARTRSVGVRVVTGTGRWCYARWRSPVSTPCSRCSAPAPKPSPRQAKTWSHQARNPACRSETAIAGSAPRGARPRAGPPS